MLLKGRTKKGNHVLILVHDVRSRLLRNDPTERTPAVCAPAPFGMDRSVDMGSEDVGSHCCFKVGIEVECVRRCWLFKQARKGLPSFLGSAPTDESKSQRTFSLTTNMDDRSTQYADFAAFKESLRGAHLSPFELPKLRLMILFVRSLADNPALEAISDELDALEAIYGPECLQIHQPTDLTWGHHDGPRVHLGEEGDRIRYEVVLT
jgi:hypothetical protein